MLRSIALTCSGLTCSLPTGSGEMLHCLRGKTLSLAGRLLSHSSSVCRPCFSSPVAFRLYQRPPTSRSVPILHLSAWNLSTRFGLHTSSQLQKRKREVKESALEYHWKEIKKIPKPAYVLGFAGALPFVAAPVYMCGMQLYIPEVAILQALYGACILSFLGGVRWGYSLPDNSPFKPNWNNLLASVFFPFVAIFSLMSISEDIIAGTICLGLGFVVCLIFDVFGIEMYELASMTPLWYKSLRVILTVVVLISLVATGLCATNYPLPKIPKVNPATPQKAPRKFQ